MKAVAILEMPKHCMECPLEWKEMLNCTVDTGIITVGKKRPSNCPLIPLPPKSDGMHIPTIKNVVDREFCEGWDRYYEELTGETE